MRKESIFNPDLTGVQKETQRQQEAKREAEEKELTLAKRISNFFKDWRTRFADQSITAQSAISNAKNTVLTHNVMGTLGASAAENFIRQGYGLASFVVVIWSICLAVRFFKRKSKVYFFSFTLISLFSLLTFSLAFSLFTLSLNLASCPLGGNFGK